MRRLPLALATVLLFAGCGATTTDSLGEAFVAPAQLNLRRELSTKSTNVTVLHHGERVSILDMRRRFVLIRTAKGQKGWVDSAQLLNAGQMATLQSETKEALQRPSAGRATAFEALNMHLAPFRASPALAQIPEGGGVEVLEHKLTPKDAPLPKAEPLINERPAAPVRHRGKERTPRAKSLLPPLPPPPKAPANWQELSSERVGGESTAEAKAHKDADAAARKAAETKKPVVLEDWSLVRTANKQAGWVLTRNLSMSIPDEVAQYAEGRHITSYFDLGSIQDEEKGVKHNWLWTTSGSGHAYDFDSWRVFLWNRRRHRYETSYRQRDVEGYFPVVVDASDPSAFGRSFHLITKDDDGVMRRRTYIFDGSRVHLTAAEPYGVNAPPPAHAAPTGGSAKPAGAPNWLARQMQRLRPNKPN